MNEILAECDGKYYQEGVAVKLLSTCEHVPAKTLILSGTPEGVMFRLATLWNPRFYLQAGDTVTSQATFLGVTQNSIE